MMGFMYNKEKDMFIHVPSTFVLDGDYLMIADNDEVRNRFYRITGQVLDDFTIGMMRAQRNETVYS